MKIQLPMIVQDPLTADLKDFNPIDTHNFTDEQCAGDFFMDGPVSKRIAVLDLTADNCALHPGAEFCPPSAAHDYATYNVGDGFNRDITRTDPRFIQVNVFGTVFLTMCMFEEKDVLGRRLKWAFDAPQLLVIPQAGNMKNAFYERDSHSLQFFWHRDPETSKLIHAALNSDVIAHETAHAILDGIAPDLYDAVTPQSLALHEAIADLTAGLIAFRRPQLRKKVLDQTGGTIENETAFSMIAESFGDEGQGYFRSLRSLNNNKTLDPAAAEKNRVDRCSPHSLSQVLSGALYSVLIKMHKDRQQRIGAQENKTPFAASGKALFVAAEQFKRMIFRALDYLPPGEVSFADYVRAILAADQAAHPDSGREREWLALEFVKRRIVSDKAALAVPCDYDSGWLQNIDLQTLVDDNWLAHEFAEENRELLGIPAAIPFNVRPRLDVTKKSYQHNGWQDLRECIFKVSWQKEEDNPLGGRYPAKRRLTVGSTMVVDWQRKKILAVLSSDSRIQQGEAAEQSHDRTNLLRWLAAEGLLTQNDGGLCSSGLKLSDRVCYSLTKNDMKVRGMGMMLHLIGDRERRAK